jgi:hypothetical protein
MINANQYAKCGCNQSVTDIIFQKLLKISDFGYIIIEQSNHIDGSDDYEDVFGRLSSYEPIAKPTFMGRILFFWRGDEHIIRHGQSSPDGSLCAIWNHFS